MTFGSWYPLWVVLAYSGGLSYIQGATKFCDRSSQGVLVLPDQFSRPLDQPLTSPAECTFVSYDPAFKSLIGEDAVLEQVGPNRTYNYAHEGAVYLRETNDLFFVSQLGNGNTTTAQAWRLNLDTEALTEVPVSQAFASFNGAVEYGDQLVVSVIGSALRNLPAGVALLDPYTGAIGWICNNYFGRHFFGGNDVVALADGSLIFNNYNSSGSSKPVQPLETPLGTYILTPDGVPQMLIDDFPESVNGLALSPDQQTLYVTTFGADPDSLTSQLAGSKIYAFDILTEGGGTFAANRRLFAFIDVGFADGLKADAAGNIWTSAGDGIQVFSPGGRLLGKILISPSSPKEQTVNSLTFADNRLVILHNQNVLQVTVNATAPPSPF